MPGVEAGRAYRFIAPLGLTVADVFQDSNNLSLACNTEASRINGDSLIIPHTRYPVILLHIRSGTIVGDLTVILPLYLSLHFSPPSPSTPTITCRIINLLPHTRQLYRDPQPRQLCPLKRAA